jgi:hypothetical protein
MTAKSISAQDPTYTSLPTEADGETLLGLEMYRALCAPGLVQPWAGMHNPVGIFLHEC